MSDEIQVPRNVAREAADLLRLLSDLTHIRTQRKQTTHARNLSKALHEYAAEDKKFRGLVQICRRAVTKVPRIGWSKDKRLEEFRAICAELEEAFLKADWEHEGQVTFYLTLVKTE